MSLLVSLPEEFSLFSFNNGMVVSSCRELDNNRSALSAASAFAIATAGANEGTPTKEKYRRMSLASAGQSQNVHLEYRSNEVCCVHFEPNVVDPGPRFSYRPEEWGQGVCYQKSCHQQSPECAAPLGLQTLAGTPHFSSFLFLSLYLSMPLKEKNTTFL